VSRDRLARALVVLALACAPAHAQAPSVLVVGAFSGATPGGALPEGWSPLNFPSVERHTRYTLVAEPPRGTAIEAVAQASASGLVRRIEIDPRTWPRLAWSWKATTLIERGDVTRKDGDDYAARLYVTFRLPPGRMSPLERAELRMARALIGDHVPDAGLSYIWDARAPVGTIVANAYTDRVKMIVVESGRERLGRWIDYERDLAADWRAAFGGDIPPISGIAIMTDADNTGESARTFYGDILLRR
jgi:hypothetical protein